MEVDVRTDILVERDRETVAGYSADPANAPQLETTYTWESVEGGSTRMTLRNRGTPSGFSRWLAPFMARAMRNANTKDLAALRKILTEQVASL